MDPFLAEIRIFGGNFAPTSWAACDGQLLPISQNTALFSLLGANYGGDGRSTFALPNLQGRAPMHTGTGPGLTQRLIAEAGGADTVTLTPDHMPNHLHPLQAIPTPATASTLQGNILAVPGEDAYAPRGTKTTVPMSQDAVAASGGSSPHNNLQPYLVLMFIIALEGVYPQRPS